MCKEGLTSQQRRKRYAELAKEGHHKQYKELKEAGLIERIPVREGKREIKKLQLCPFCKGISANLSQEQPALFKKAGKSYTFPSRGKSSPSRSDTGI